VQVKCVAVRCILIALKHLTPAGATGAGGVGGVGLAHTDLALARSVTTAALRGLLNGGGVGVGVGGGVGGGVGVGVGGGGDVGVGSSGLVVGGAGTDAGTAVAVEDGFGGFETGGFEAGGFEAGGFEAGGFEAGGFEAGGFETGGFEAGGFEAGGFEAGGFEAAFPAAPVTAPAATSTAIVPTSTPTSTFTTSLAEALTPIPRYLSLFLTDLLNLACACATFALEEKPVLLLQTEVCMYVICITIIDTIIHHILTTSIHHIGPYTPYTLKKKNNANTPTSLRLLVWFAVQWSYF
jgi:hypothetical protein